MIKVFAFGPLSRLASAVMLISTMGACTAFDSVKDWVSETQEPRLPGERQSVLGHQKDLVVDPRLVREPVVLPAPYMNTDWPQNGGFPSHALHHLSLESDTLSVRWRKSIGTGSSSDLRLISMPIVANGILYAIDAETRVVAMNAKSGERLWRYSLVPDGESDDNSVGGGVAYYEDRLIVTTAFGDVFALDANNGGMIWRTHVGQPFRVAPTVSNGAVIAISFNNQLHVMRVESGELVWNHSGVPERADVMGGAAPAVSDGRLVAAFSSGELVTFALQSGSIIWQDSLARRGRLTALQSLADINAHPIIDRGMVFAVGHSGRMIAANLETGLRIWDAKIGGVNTPWVAGDYVFILNNESELLCLNREDGRVRWSTAMPRYENPGRRRDAIQWSGPLLASDRLIITSSEGEAWSLSPYDGQMLGYQKLPDKVFLAPIVADGWLYILTDDGDIVAMN